MTRTARLLPFDPFRVAIILLAIAFWASIAGAASGCGPSARQQALKTTFVAAKTAQAGFVAWDREHLSALARSAVSIDDGLAKIAAYKDASSPVVAAFEGVYRALAAAALLDDDPKSLTAALGAFEQLRLALHTLTEGRLP